MSTLSEMAALICTELGLFDDTSIVLCKQFLNRQYITLWDKYPWRDANGGGGGVVQVPAGTPRVNYPDGMDRLITLRVSQFIPGMAPPAMPDAPDAPEFDPDAPDTPDLIADARFLDPVDPTFLMESDPGIFERYGYVKYYQDRAQGGVRVVRLYPVPTTEITLFFWGKMICPGLTADDSVCLIRNLEPAIVAYAYFDMLQRQRQYGKADLKRKEAQELEANAWNLEQQQANQPRRTKATTVAGNSLSEMTDAVCQICGQWTPEYRQVIREFLRRNYQEIYDAFLWPESLVVVTLTYSDEQLILPYYIDKVLAVRAPNSKARMAAVDATLILDIDPTIFGEMGNPVYYTTLTPVGVSSLPTATTKLVLASTSNVDVTPVAIRGEVFATGQEFEETVILRGTTPVTTVNTYNTVLTFAKEITIGTVTLNAVNDNRLLGQLRANRREKKHQRLWLLPPLDVAIAQSLNVLVMGKRTIRPLVSDQDTPIITGVQQALIAGAAADLYLKLEKLDLATQYQGKADAALAALQVKDTSQANRPQITSQTTVAGNSLAEMTDAVCMICGQWTPEIKLATKEFIRRNYQQLYDAFLFPESVVCIIQTYISEQLIFPSYIDRVLAVRAPNSKLRMAPTDATTILDLDPTIFGELGDPVMYSTLTPVAVALLPTATTRLTLVSTSDFDIGKVAIRGENFGGNQELREEVTLTGTTPVLTQHAYDVPLTIAKDITVGDLSVTATIDSTLLCVIQSYRREKKHQRLWLLPPLDTATANSLVVVAMCKRAIEPLFNDEDTPVITGIQQVLIAAAAADLYLKLEKLDLSAQYQRKADGAVKTLQSKNTDQAASSPRFVPQIEPRSYVAGCTW